MVKGLNAHATFAVEETLWDGEKCRVKVNDDSVWYFKSDFNIDDFRNDLTTVKTGNIMIN